MQDMDAGKISRLRDEQIKAVQETNEQIQQFEKFKSDYKALQTRLKTLPDKISHDVMVPFGKLAFMPGKIVHTNEVLVLLGDNWFAERSAKQASDIAGRRIKELDKKINDLKEQKSLLEPRLGITSELQAQAEGRGDYQEIVEEYDEEKEKLWDKQHKVNVRRYHQKLKEERSQVNDQGRGQNKCRPDQKEASNSITTDDELWSRLEALEKQEDERRELNSSCESTDTDTEETTDIVNQIEEKDPLNRETFSVSKDKRVSWVDLAEEVEGKQKSWTGEDFPRQSDDEEEDDEDYDESDDSENRNRPVVKTIRFSHTKSLITQLPESPAQSSQITSPADIYKLFSPKSILKKQSHNPVVPDSTGDHQSPHSLAHDSDSDKPGRVSETSITSQTIAASRDKAFSGIVKEASSSAPSSSKSQTVSQPSQDQPKRVSKFKAQRMNQNQT